MRLGYLLPAIITKNNEKYYLGASVHVMIYGFKLYQIGLTLVIIKIKVFYPALRRKHLHSLTLANQRHNMISPVTIRQRVL